jgi:FkbM family methyltransferase
MTAGEPARRKPGQRMRAAKDAAKKVLPDWSIYFYHSVRAALKVGVLGPLLSTLPNASSKVRLGGEAGWTIPRALFSETSICYCIGCGEDITFDLELIRNYRCNVFAFDPTPRAIAHVAKHAAGVANYRLSEFAIWEKNGTVRFYTPPDDGVSHSITNLNGTSDFIEVPTRRLRDVIESNGHSSIALLKMDIEGAEHTVIRTIIDDKLNVDVLCVEFDELAHATPERIGAIRQTLQGLLDYGFTYYWIEGSNFTFVRRELLSRLRAQ